MTPPIGFRTDKEADSITGIRPVQAAPDAAPATAAAPSRTADYAYRIAALTAGLILLATVM
ncbi:MAG TPA: hypothetical protein VGB69_02115 [Edaphobacter sp.]